MPCNLIVYYHYFSVSGLSNLRAFCSSGITPCFFGTRHCLGGGHRRKVVSRKLERLGCVMCHAWCGMRLGALWCGVLRRVLRVVRCMACLVLLSSHIFLCAQVSSALCVAPAPVANHKREWVGPLAPDGLRHDTSALSLRLSLRMRHRDL